MEKKLIESFKKTKIKFNVEVERTYPWVSIQLPHLNCEEMDTVSKWIKDNFSEDGRFSHLLPKLGVRHGSFCLVISKEQCQEKFGS